MPRGASITVENSFARGLITEFTPMNFPEQAVTETDNCVYDETGRVTRRLGIDVEPGHAQRVNPGGNDPQTSTREFEWYSVGNSGNTKIVVQQVGIYLIFFRPVENGAISASHIGTIDINAFAISGTSAIDISRQEVSFTTGRGYLFVAHPMCNPIYIEYNPDTGALVANQIIVKVRDVEGVPEDADVAHRPLSLSSAHHYNLFNQGWSENFLGSQTLFLWQSNGFANTGPRTDFPSNADIWWIYKRTALQDEGREAGLEIFDSQMANTLALGNTPAPKGHYIYDAFNINRSAVTSVPGIPLESSGSARPSAIAFYAGRVWYAGTRANKYSSRAYFSQLIERPDQFGNCFQINDPTSESTFDIIDTDGGTLELPLIQQVTGFQTLKDALIVFGTNGIYSIRGSDAGPFRATNYTVEFISSIGVENPKAVVQIDDGLMWWGTDAMYTLQPDQVGLSFQVQNVSLATIQGLLDDVPYDNKRFIKAAYNRRQRIAQWIYSDRNDLSGYQYNKILELRVLSNSFYTHTINIGQGLMKGLISFSGQVIDEVGGVETFVPSPEVFKYFCVLPNGFVTYAQLFRPELRDWITTSGGVPYDSTFVTGYRVRGDVLRKFNTTPSIFIAETENNASLIVRGVWDHSARESMPQEIYRRPTRDVTTARLKIRGKGRSLQFRFNSTGNRPFSLLGWATLDSGGTVP